MFYSMLRVKGGCVKGRRESFIERGTDRQTAALEDVGVDHGSAHVFMAKEFLDGTDVVAVLEEVGSKGVTEGVGGDVLGDTGLTHGSVDGTLE